MNILLAAAIVVLSIKLVNDKSDGKQSAQDGQDAGAIENIMTRTSIRDYQPRPVEDEKIEQMLRAAMAAPSAGNKQPWRFIVIKDKNTLQAISANFNTMKMAQKAPLAIVVCGDLTATYDGEGTGYWIEDASAATENMLLAAHSLGLGAVWCGVYPLTERVELLKKMLNIPDDVIPLNVVPIGYPAESPEPKDKWNPDDIHYETWTGADANLHPTESAD